jgi:catechol 2,3-dioxygenase-like lactoylglutathione lyase family enzyme
MPKFRRLVPMLQTLDMGRTIAWYEAVLGFRRVGRYLAWLHCAQGTAANARRSYHARLHSRTGSFRPEQLEFHTIGESRIRHRARVDNGHFGRWRHCLRKSRAWNSRRLAMDVPYRARGRRSRSDPFRLSTRLGRAARGLSGRPSTLSQGKNHFRLSRGAAHAQ